MRIVFGYSETTINLPFIAADATGPKHTNQVLTRQKFEELVADLVEQTIEPCQKALWDAKLQPGDIDKVVLVGGQTRSPVIAQTVAELFGSEPSTEINPDEVVAMGAAIQGGVMTGDIKDIVLLDVLPLSLGLETRGGIFVKLINRNSTIPLKNQMTFTTVADNQQSVEIHVMQGEREVSSGNRSLGKFELVGIPPAPRGLPQIDVAFEVDANGIVNVSAKDKMTGLEQAVQITPSSGLAPDEIDRLIMEAEVSVESDRATKDLIQQRNRLDSLVRNTRQTMSEFGRALAEEDRLAINQILDYAEEMLAAEQTDITQIEQTAAEVEAKAGKLTEAMMAIA